MENFSKIVRVGTVSYPWYFKGNKAVSIYCKIGYTDGRLSISGVIGPKSNGGCVGGAGQIDMEFAHRDPAEDDRRTKHLTHPDQINFAAGWDADKWLDFLHIWKKWHLNDMKANCEHQVGPDWNTQKELAIYHFRITPDARKAQREANEAAEKALKAGEAFTPTHEQVLAANWPYAISHHGPELPEGIAPHYKPKKPLYAGDSGPVEYKAAGWVRPEEHPEGLLCKPCPVCGYKYGSAWKRVEVPTEVLAWLSALPDADHKPAWV